MFYRIVTMFYLENEVTSLCFCLFIYFSLVLGNLLLLLYHTV